MNPRAIEGQQPGWGILAQSGIKPRELVKIWMHFMGFG